MKRNLSKNNSYSKIGSRAYIMLAGLILFELFLISTGLVVRDVALTWIRDSNIKATTLSQGVLPLTGTEDSSIDLTNYPLFLGVTGFIIVVGVGGLIYLVLKKDTKAKRGRTARVLTILGIIVLSGATIAILLSRP
jgi:hypothetical protein